MEKKSIRIAVTGAAGQIGYALLFRIAAGEMFGAETQVHLNLLELERALPALKGIIMELEDCAFPLLASVTATSNLQEAFKDIDWAFLVGSVPRKDGMERGDLLRINGKIFVEQGKALDKFANVSCRVLVVGNPCNTNALIAKSVAKNLSRKNFFAMTMLDQHRAVAQIAQKAAVSISEIKKLAVWGNHSSTQFPDFFHATVKGKPVRDVIGDDQWLQTSFIETVAKRGAQIIKARGLSSAASAANAALETVRKLTKPTSQEDFFSVAVCSDGSYDVPEGLMFSFPIRCNGRDWEIVRGIKHNDFSKEKIAITVKELLKEKEAVQEFI